METFYDAYLTGGVSNLAPYFSERLTSEMAGIRLSPELIASLGIDPLFGATDAQVAQLSFDSNHDGEAERATVSVSFHNRNVPVELTFELIREAEHGWQIDHFEGVSGSVEWCSRRLVEAAKQATPD